MYDALKKTRVSANIYGENSEQTFKTGLLQDNNTKDDAGTKDLTIDYVVITIWCQETSFNVELYSHFLFYKTYCNACDISSKNSLSCCEQLS